jgi:hypothetical protein
LFSLGVTEYVDVLFGLAIEGGKVMTAEKTTMAFGWRVYGLGVMALAMVCLALGDFLPGQPVPKDFPDRTALAYAAGAFMLVAGAAVEWRRTAAWGGAALTAYYALIVVILMNGRVVLAHYAEFLTYEVPKSRWCRLPPRPRRRPSPRRCSERLLAARSRFPMIKTLPLRLALAPGSRR